MYRAWCYAFFLLELARCQLGLVSGVGRAGSGAGRAGSGAGRAWVGTGRDGSGVGRAGSGVCLAGAGSDISFVMHPASFS